ncbi:MAG TPA: hypothetical protein PLN52_13960 [Opitutaceae bacterium]|nr:hypothetical protein [Opitutaceae bacterium]
MINKTKLTLTLALLGLPCAIFAQSGDAVTSLDRNAYGPVAGEREVVIGGSGGSNKDFDDSFGGVNVSLSQFVNDMLSVGIRQSVNYVNPQNGGSAWNGSTRIAVDQHFMAGPIRPSSG